jgi:zinc transporter ZupT
VIPAIASAALTFFSTLAGGTAALRWPRHVQSLMALAGGVMLAAVFLDLLPDAVQRAVDLQMPVGVPLGTVLLGYLTFQLVDHVIQALEHRGNGA